MIFYTYCECDENDKSIPKYEECKLVKGIRLDRRNTDNPTKIRAYKGEKDWWYSEGKNHRIENGEIVRQFDDEFYIININSLNELLKLQDKYKIDVVLGGRSGYVYNGKELKRLSECNCY